MLVKEDNDRFAPVYHIRQRQVAGDGDILQVNLETTGKLDSSLVVYGIKTLQYAFFIFIIKPLLFFTAPRSRRCLYSPRPGL
ncbi:hypothetical protein ACFLYB_06310 [Chloroflexota bacterium]